MATDITDIVHRYRLALRHIWNSCMWVDPNLRDWDSVAAFRDLKLPLYQTLVAYPLDLEYTDFIFGPRFLVVPDMEAGGLASMYVNLKVPSSAIEGDWQQFSGPFTADDVVLSLVDFFDWNALGVIDFRFYIVLIEQCRQFPERIGQHALVEVSDSFVVLE